MLHVEKVSNRNADRREALSLGHNDEACLEIIPTTLCKGHENDASTSVPSVFVLNLIKQSIIVCVKSRGPVDTFR